MTYFFSPEFGLEMQHIGYLNPPLSSYLFSLKYDFHELRSHTWLSIHPSSQHMKTIPYIMDIDRHHQNHLHNMLQAALWIIRKNAKGENELAKKLAKNFITTIAACRYINKMYHNKL